MEQDKSLQVQANDVVQNGQDTGIFMDVQKFEFAQRVAKMFSESTMVPDHFRNNVGNCMIALNFAARVGLDPFATMQKMYIVKGRPGIEGQLIIALINKSGRFSPLRFRFEGESKQRQCTAYATDLKSGEVLEQTVTWGMVEAEGWNKVSKGIKSKWLTLPDLMFQYRSAAFFGRLFCPDVLMGIATKDELDDISSQQQPPAIENLPDRLKNITPAQTDIVAEPEQNELHQTPEWKEWKDVKELFPNEAASLPEPINTAQCLDAVKHVKQIIDGGNA